MQRTASMNKITHDREQEPIVVSKIVTDLILKEDKPMELMGLYWFLFTNSKVAEKQIKYDALLIMRQPD